MSYQEVLEAWKKERERDELCPLPEDFFIKASEYLRKLKSRSEGEDLQSIVSASECKRVEAILKEIVKVRWFKIMKSVEQGQVPKSGLAEGEGELVKQAMVAAEAYHKFLEAILEGKLRRRAYALVRFLKPVPALVGIDLKSYGPFNEEDVANLPIENAEALVKQGLAVFLRSS